MKAILISGFAKTGKTTTCNLLKDKIEKRRGGYQLIFDGLPSSKKEIRSIYKIDNNYIAISSLGDSWNCVEDGFNVLLNEAINKGIELDIIFFTSRTKGNNYKGAISLAKKVDPDYYNFFSNEIQAVPTPVAKLESQKSRFLDFILDTSGVTYI